MKILVVEDEQSLREPLVYLLQKEGYQTIEAEDGIQAISLFESGAILLYLAAKTGKFLPKTDRQKYEVLQWLMFQMGGVGPMLGQNHHFRLYAPEKIEYAINRYTSEAKRLYGVMDKQVSKTKFIAGNTYTIEEVTPWREGPEFHFRKPQSNRVYETAADTPLGDGATGTGERG